MPRHVPPLVPVVWWGWWAPLVPKAAWHVSTRESLKPWSPFVGRVWPSFKPLAAMVWRWGRTVVSAALKRLPRWRGPGVAGSWKVGFGFEGSGKGDWEGDWERKGDERYRGKRHKGKKV